MGHGRRRIDGTYLSTRRPYREVTQNDTDVDLIEEVIDLTVTEDGQGTPSGYDAYLALFVHLRDGVTAADIELFVDGDEEVLGAQGSESSIPGGESEYCLVDSLVTVNGSKLLTFQNLPAAQYKVRVTGIAGAGTVIVREAHSA